MSNAAGDAAPLAELLRSGFQPHLMPKHKKGLQRFSYQQPTLGEGKKKSLTRLCTTDMIYSAMHMLQEGGDAPLHLHAAMDQVWFVVQGPAVFQDGEGNAHTVNQFEGMCVPRGTAYGYRKDGPSPLLLLQFVALNAKAKKNTLKFLGVKHNAEVQDVTSARTELHDAMLSA